ncbi:MAG TPA: enoyl-CoA hydratase-related protein [Candidatus Nitrosotalea sp.]|nr:enoyl-CoA hydratase-related protein [Candidatus Nitrosotalea sp.]
MATVELTWPDPERIALLTLNRPRYLNALDTEMTLSLENHLLELDAARRLRCVIVTGAGERAFCSGADLKERGTLSTDEWMAQHHLIERMLLALRRLRVPIFSAVNGLALGGGCEIAMQTDFIIASEAARFGQPEVTRGIIPGAGGTQNLPRRLPRGTALRMLFSGETIDAARALDLGLVSEVVAPEQLMPCALALGQRIAANSAFAVRQAKRATRLGLDLTAELAYEVELEAYRRTVGHPDQIEGVRAFNEGREPVFTDPS